MEIPMKKLKIYYRTLARNWVFSVISIGGFSLSLAVVILLTAFIRSERQYDRAIPELDHIYRILGANNSAYIPEQARDRILSDYPQVVAATKCNNGNDVVLYNQANFNVSIVHTDSGFFSVFSVPVISGMRSGWFKDPHQAVLTESCATRIFGSEDPIGKVLNISHREDLEVVAVVQDLPEKSSLKGEMFCSAELRLRYSLTSHNESEAYLYNIYLRFQPGNGPGILQDKLTALIHPFMEWKDVDYRLQPFQEVYFDITSHDNLDHANVKLIRLLGWLTLIILFLAVFNYINLTIAQSTGRLHELGVKQVFGADRSFLIRQFMNEAFLQIILALFLAFGLALLMKPLVSDILGKKIELMMVLENTMALIEMLLGLVLIALISGIYPALAILRLQPKQMLINQPITTRRSFDIRRVLTMIQFTAMVALIISLITLLKQIRYVQDMDMGYNTEWLVRIPVHYQIQDKAPVLLQEISQMASVKTVCGSTGTPGEIWSEYENDKVRTSQITADYRFVETFGLEMIYGRNFFEAESTDVCLVNRSLLNDLGGWDSAENKSLFGGRVVGAFEDFHYQDLYTPIGNLQLKRGTEVSHIVIRFYPGDIAASVKQVEHIFREEASGFAFSYEFYDDWLEARYTQEEKRAASIRLLSVIAVLLSCMGLFGMAQYTARRRMREIGIRKVNGASSGSIVRILNLSFLKWIIPGIVAGIPLGWYFMHRWLSSFAYRTRLDWWIFLAASLVAILVALLTISWQTWRAARRNPVESLRYE
jgi:putative ABC transport system permease protein